MSFTLTEAIERLRELTREVDQATNDLRRAEQDAVKKREAYTHAYATAFLTAEGAMEIRRQQALLETAPERIAAETADEIVRGLKRRLATLGLRVEIGRSISSALKAELATLGSAP